MSLTRLKAIFAHICIWRGILLPLVAVAIALHALIENRTILIPPGRTRIWLTGNEAAAMAVAWFGVAIALHAHFVWSNVEFTWRFAGLGTIAGILMIAGGWGYALASALLPAVS